MKNLKTIQEFGYHILEPESGFLASGLDGKGRLPEIETILDTASEIIGFIEGPLQGKKVLVTAGPTREFIDPVRFISNPSSGKMGVAMAKAAQRLGAEVILVHGPVTTDLPEDMRCIPVISAHDMFEAVKIYADADYIIMAAAVSDFTPKETFEHKVKKGNATSSVSLKQTQDILQWLGEYKKADQVLIGFAMETQDLLSNAKKKLNSKKADWILANSLSTNDSGFGTDTNEVYVLGKETEHRIKGTKQEVAEQALNFILDSE